MPLLLTISSQAAQQKIAELNENMKKCPTVKNPEFFDNLRKVVAGLQEMQGL